MKFQLCSVPDSHRQQGGLITIKIKSIGDILKSGSKTNNPASQIFWSIQALNSRTRDTNGIESNSTNGIESNSKLHINRHSIIQQLERAEWQPEVES